MEGWNWKCFCWNRGGGLTYDRFPIEPEHFSLPSPIPQWPKGKGFAEGTINIGELELAEVTKFQSIWSSLESENKNKNKGVVFYKPVEIPDGFFCLGHHGQLVDCPLSAGSLLVARDVGPTDRPALRKPLDYSLLWTSGDDGNYGYGYGYGYFWVPCPPEGYKAVGHIVTKGPDKPSLEEVRCVRDDLTDTCEAHGLIFDSGSSDNTFSVWRTRPSLRGIWERGISVGTFTCGSSKDDTVISCLKNSDSSLAAMPNLDQIHAIISHYGPTVYFHPKEIYLPSSVSWFFKNGASLFKKGSNDSTPIDIKGSNLPCGGNNDGEYWIDLPDEGNNFVKRGNIDSAELYVHVKPAVGGIFTDIAMWVFCPFNGPATLKLGLASIPLGKIGQHVSDWEHFTLRVSNFNGELRSIYFSQHSCGEWVDTSNLEYVSGNKAAVYSTKHGHASFAHAGTYLQGSGKLGIGIRNDAERSDFVVDSSTKYKIVAAEYLGDEVAEPDWLQFMREWGPTVRYNSRKELEKLLRYLPVNIRFTVENVFDKLPVELYREEGPTGPKEKNNWVGDERW